MTEFYMITAIEQMLHLLKSYIFAHFPNQFKFSLDRILLDKLDSYKMEKGNVYLLTASKNEYF